MPRKYTKRRRYARRGATKKRFYRKRRSIIRTGPGRMSATGPINQTGLGFPANKIVKMRYVSSAQLPFGIGGVITQQSFRANGIYDPDTAVGGHQPMGRDQWAPFYNHYVVLGCTITATLSHLVGLPGRTMVIGAYLDDDTTAATDWRELAESGRASWALVNPGSSIGSTHNMKSVSCYFSAKKFFNVKDVKDNLDRIGAPFGADPTEEAIFKVFVATADQITVNENTVFDLTITLDYTVMMSEPKTLPLS